MDTDSRLREVRLRRGLTQDQLAARAQVDQGHVSRLERGQRQTPGVDVARRLAEALGVSVAHLFPAPASGGGLPPSRRGRAEGFERRDVKP